MNFKRGKSVKESLGIESYIYDNGFGPRYYVCVSTSCRSIKLKRMTQGVFQPPAYLCEECGYISISPYWVNLDSETLEPVKDNKVEFRIDK